MKNKSFWSILVSALVALLLLGACTPLAPAPAPTTRPTQAAAPAPGTTGAAAPAPAPSPTRAAAPATAQTKPTKLVIVQGSEPPDLDWVVLGGEMMETSIGNIYETLVGRDRQMNPTPKLAERWEMVAPDRWRFYLRKGVKFHNGDDFKAQDVVDTVNWAVELNTSVQKFLEAKSAVAVDDYTVDIITNVPMPRLITAQLRLYIYPSRIAKDRKFAKNDAIGTGPYKLQEWVRGSHIRLVRNENYWGPKPSIQQAEITFRPESAVRVASLQAGEAQFVFPLEAEQTSMVPKLVSIPGPDSLYLRMDTKYIQNSIFKDKRVRQALQYAIDRDALVKLFLSHATKLEGQSTLPGWFGYNPDVKGYPYDLAKAKALIKEAGVEGAEINFVGGSGRRPKDRETAEAIAFMVEQTGLKVKFRIAEFSDWLNFSQPGRGGTKNYSDIFVNGCSSFFEGESAMSKVYQSKGTSNTCVDPKADELIKAAFAEVDLKAREEKIRKFWEYAREEANIVWLYDPNFTFGLAKNLQWDYAPDGKPFFSDMRLE